jgi:flavin reductase (DIM6/NTAB) family NADH-FMN oxidoreductase RutF
LGRRAFKRLPPDPSAQVEVDNDRARWPCFFPSPVGMISTWDDDGRPNLMPCGSTTVVSRQPLVIAPCISYSPINARYAPRATLDYIRRRGRFGCGVAFDAPGVLDAIAYLGNVSSRRDADKLTHAGLELADLGETPCASLFPIHYDCRVVGEVALGTHVMVLGEVERIFARDDLETAAPLVWRPWADVEAAG